MPDVGGPDRWPVWCMGAQPTSPASQPRLRVVFGFHFEADDFVVWSTSFAKVPLDVWRDNRGRWSVSESDPPKEK